MGVIIFRYTGVTVQSRWTAWLLPSPNAHLSEIKSDPASEGHIIVEYRNNRKQNINKIRGRMRAIAS